MALPILGDGALFVLPSQRVQAQIMPWRRRYDPEHWRTIPPHITVVYPFVRHTDWPEVKPAFTASLQAFQPFWITLAELGVFESPQAVLWFRPADNGMLARIRAALGEQFPAYVHTDALGFVPHLTVGFFDSQAAMTQAKTTIAANWQPLRFRVQSLCYATLHEDGFWRTCDRLPFGKRLPPGGR